MRSLIALFALLFAPLAFAETNVLVGQSDEDVALNVTFNGQDILIYGAIDDDENEDFDVAIIVEGPPQDVIVTRKEKRLGLWLNLQSKPFGQVPSYSAILSSEHLEQIIDWDTRISERIGLRSKIDPNWIQHEDRAFIEGLVRNKARRGQYVINESGVDLQGDVLFSGRVPLPASLIDGDFDVEIFIFKDKKILAHSHSTISVYKSGVDAWIFDLAQFHGWAYGLLTIFLAIISALLAKAFTNLFRR